MTLAPLLSLNFLVEVFPREPWSCTGRRCFAWKACRESNKLLCSEVWNASQSLLATARRLSGSIHPLRIALFPPGSPIGNSFQEGRWVGILP